MKALEIMTLSGAEARALGQAYSDGRVETEPMLNLLMQTPAGRALASLGLHLLPLLLPKAHFGFEGNRPYGMAAAANGEIFALISWEARDATPDTGTVRMELVKQAALPFLAVESEPNDAAVRRAMVGLIAFCADGWRSLPDGPEKEFGREGMATLLENSPRALALRAAVLDGQPPEVVLAEFLEPQTPEPSVSRTLRLVKR